MVGFSEFVGRLSSKREVHLSNKVRELTTGSPAGENVLCSLVVAALKGVKNYILM